MIRPSALCLVCILLLLPGGEAGAQEIPSPFEFIEEAHSVGAFGGYLWTARGEKGLGIASLPIGGVRYNLRFGGPATGEAALTLGPTTRTVHRMEGEGEERASVPVGEADVLFAMAEAGVRFHLTGQRTWRNLAPYLVGTAGVAGDLRGGGRVEEDIELPEDQRFRFGPALAVGIGAGTDWFPAPRFSLRLEVRDQIWRVTTPLGLRDAEGETGEWVNNFGLSLGAALHF